MHSQSHPHSLPVVIVGGSLVGLSTALFLALRDVPVILLEKHLGSAAHPRAMGFTERTLEYFRVAGLGERIPQVAPGTRLRRVRADSLAGAWHEETQWTPGEPAPQARAAALSPCFGAAIAQDKLEPILRAAAAERGADLRFGVEMTSFAQDADGVSFSLRRRDGLACEDIRASYLIAADGADSGVRTALGIGRTGVGHLRTLRSVLFHCPGADIYLARGVQQFAIEQAGFDAFLTSYGDGRWVVMTEDDGRAPADPAALVRGALGTELAFTVLATGRWELAGRIAERYREGRVFLAGDAAHQLPPTRGGFGANTGIDDAFNLAWKLAWVLRGDAAPALLDSYDAERQPIGWLRHQQTFARPDYARWAGGACDGVALYGNDALELGQLLRSKAVIGAGPTLPPAAHPDAWAGQPGTRAPHLWGRYRGERVSTIDLLTTGFVLLSEDPRWIAAARETAANLALSIGAVHVGADLVFEEEEAFRQRFGVAAGGAVLVRPDGIVAWRSGEMVDRPAAVLKAALEHILALT